MDRTADPGGSPPVSLPRERGDGPCGPVGHSRRFGPPPRARGWTSPSAHSASRPPASPASAGMDRFPVGSASTWRGLPRECGDGPLSLSVSGMAIRPPPRARGWTSGEPVFAAVEWASPASAGMDLGGGMASLMSDGLPRERGDGPRPRLGSVRGFGPPPRARGWTAGAHAETAYANASPASAGMDRIIPFFSGSQWCLPRERGDGPWSGPPTSFSVRPPPRARGWTRGSSRAPSAGRASPASAGMDPCSAVVPSGGECLPRERGDGPSRPRAFVVMVEPPPRARGWTRIRLPAQQASVASPASAGMDRPRSSGRPVRRRLPRERGDGPRWSACFPFRPVPPPRARGWTRSRLRDPGRLGASPASAGMDPP